MIKHIYVEMDIAAGVQQFICLDLHIVVYKLEDNFEKKVH